MRDEALSLLQPARSTSWQRVTHFLDVEQAVHPVFSTSRRLIGSVGVNGLPHQVSALSQCWPTTRISDRGP